MFDLLDPVFEIWRGGKNIVRQNPDVRSLSPCSGTALLLLGLLICVASGAVPDTQEKEGKILIAVYTSGGSLETDYGLITDDIRQMVKGIGNTTPDTLEVVVAYGGSEKPGWDGMRVANLSLLASDLADGEIGNRTYTLETFPDADLGTADTLGAFLSWIHSHYRYDRVFLILIGHGEAYTGMLFDQNHKDDPLTLTELTKALQLGGFNLELIGFDTCMMSSLEVATRVSGYAAYMIASEESEPAEGWQYDRFVSAAAAHPDAPVEDLGRTILDTYLDSPVQGKTLSLLNLDNTGVVTANLDLLSENLEPLLATPEGFKKISETFDATQQFGLTANGTLDPATMDLYDMAESLVLADPSLSEPAGMLISSIQDMVLQSVHDDAVPRAHGLAILSPLQISSPFYHYYMAEASITPSWDGFMTRYLEIADETRSHPAPADES